MNLELLHLENDALGLGKAFGSIGKNSFFGATLGKNASQLGTSQNSWCWTAQ
jgi:hypothetical protein